MSTFSKHKIHDFQRKAMEDFEASLFASRIEFMHTLNNGSFLPLSSALSEQENGITIVGTGEPKISILTRCVRNTYCGTSYNIPTPMYTTISGRNKVSPFPIPDLRTIEANCAKKKEMIVVPSMHRRNSNFPIQSLNSVFEENFERRAREVSREHGLEMERTLWGDYIAYPKEDSVLTKEAVDNAIESLRSGRDTRRSPIVKAD